MKFSFSCFSSFDSGLSSCFCWSSSDSSSGFVSRVRKSLRSGEMGEMDEGLGFGVDERREGGVVVGKVGVDVGENRADGEGVGGGEFSFWFRG